MRFHRQRTTQAGPPPAAPAARHTLPPVTPEQRAAAEDAEEMPLFGPCGAAVSPGPAEIWRYDGQWSKVPDPFGCDDAMLSADADHIHSIEVIGLPHLIDLLAKLAPAATASLLWTVAEDLMDLIFNVAEDSHREYRRRHPTATQLVKRCHQEGDHDRCVTEDGCETPGTQLVPSF